ncbi:VOC family protein [Paraglaciecola chathamensis]|uniref:Glyoxalase n=1 Tax=Paraglaciecola chathamensis TaxID=368405 RepID=A0A8H9M0A3_9ALTE|nr:VOC family protein [Paraglaciecola oceanifecundans]GGZ63499.1 glyoxalase [Paraglaciecola oceanifecundans]
MFAHHKINYIEIPVTDIKVAKAFFNSVFDWQFIDYGPDYCSFDGVGIDGGFFSAKQNVSTGNGSVLVVLYSDDLVATQANIEASDGKIVQAIFSFPGGRRFHFTDPCGNEYAVWSDK